MEFVPTEIPDVVLIKPKVFGDARGFFLEYWQYRKFSEAGIDCNFVQANHSRSEANILRGLHYQIQFPQGKLVRVVRGVVFDVAVDVRSYSPTVGRWVGQYLSEENQRMLWIPPGFAHGFYVVEGPADFEYQCTDYYSPENERCIIWSDPELAIQWPVDQESSPKVSEKDASGAAFRDAELF